MKFALIDNIKTEASKGAIGICPCCGSKLIAKCGDVKVNHWSHQGIRNCDLWWENETEWHREWKGNFTKEWQEVIHTDETTGERHIADIKTSHGLVVEFQHSQINPIERISRERFYKNLVWVVDGTRLKRDYPRFLKGQNDFHPAKEQGLFQVDFPEECFPSAWVGSSTHVVFDFKGMESINDNNDFRNYLYYLFPTSNVKGTFVARLTRESFINNIVEGKWFPSQNQSQQQSQISQPKNTLNNSQSQSQFVFHNGRMMKRRRL
jgi:competence protein CoiA